MNAYETVMPALVCRSGHPNEPHWHYCISCGASLDDPLGELDGPPRAIAGVDHRPGREYVIALVILLLALAVAGTTLGLVLRHGSNGLAAANLSSSSHQRVTSGGTGDPRTAAVAVNRLLVASEGSRSSVQQAVGQIASCADVAGAVHALQMAAADRQQLISTLGGLDLSALPRSMVDDLTSSWLSSFDSDISYARWGQDEAGGCSVSSYSDSNYQAAIGTDGQASTSKGAFLTLWDPLAVSNGLPQWQSSQI